MSELRDKLLNTSNIPKERVTLKAFENAEVEVRALTTGQRLRLVKECTINGEVDQYKLIPALMLATTYDPKDGALVFTPMDAGPLADTYASGLDDLLAVALRLNGFDNPTEAVKNSASSPTSTSLSPSLSDSGNL